MSKPLIKAMKAYRDGCVKVRVSASSYGGGRDVSASVAVDLPLEVAKQFLAELATAIEKEEAKVKAKQDSEERRKKWRDREVAAGRLKIMSLRDFVRGSDA
jgi:hypothetical protein